MTLYKVFFFTLSFLKNPHFISPKTLLKKKIKIDEETFCRWRDKDSQTCIISWRDGKFRQKNEKEEKLVDSLADKDSLALIYDKKDNDAP